MAHNAGSTIGDETMAKGRDTKDYEKYMEVVEVTWPADALREAAKVEGLPSVDDFIERRVAIQGLSVGMGSGGFNFPRGELGAGEFSELADAVGANRELWVGDGASNSLATYKRIRDGLLALRSLRAENPNS